VNDDWILSPALLSQTRFGYTFNKDLKLTPIQTSWADFGSQNPYADNLASPYPPIIRVTGYWTGLNTGDDMMPMTTYEGSQTFSWTRGAHSLKFGGSILHNNFVEHAPGARSGQVGFTGAFTGLAPADFLLGMSASFQEQSGLVRDFNTLKYAAFIQDNWKIVRRLTLDLGLRYEINPPYSSTTGQIGTFRAGVQSQRYPAAPLGLVYPGDPGVPDGLVPTIYTNFMPRVGIAYDLFGNGRTAHSRGLWHIQRHGPGQHHFRLSDAALSAKHSPQQHTESGEPVGEFSGWDSFPLLLEHFSSDLHATGQPVGSGGGVGNAVCATLQPGCAATVG
jgi:outer membrane receptor protein involved in Fe transport